MKKIAHHAVPRFERFMESVTNVIVMIGCIFFAGAVASTSFEQSVSLVLSALAVSGGLSGLCFSLSSTELPQADRDSARYAGEKLLHGSILILQAIIVMYVAQKMSAWPIIRDHFWLAGFVKIAASSIATFLASFAAWACYYAIESINANLWRRFRERRAKVLVWRDEPTPSETGKSAPTKDD